MVTITFAGGNHAQAQLLSCSAPTREQMADDLLPDKRFTTFYKSN